MDEDTALARGLRVVLYENVDRIAKMFEQRFPNVVESVTNGEFTAEVSGGIASVFSVGGARSASAGHTIQTTPMMQALLLEEAAAEGGWLTDLSERIAQRGDELLRFVGDGMILAPGQPVTALPEFALTQEGADEIQRRRTSQEQWMRATDPDLPGTLVLVASGAGPVASIASLRGAHSGTLASYAQMPPFGVLGSYEGGSGTLTLIAPLMIWHQVRR